MKYLKILSTLVLIVFGFLSLSAQNKYTLSGYVKDKNSGETLIGAAIQNKDKLSQGTVSNAYGFYSITLPEGTYQFNISYIGYNTSTIEVVLTQNQQLNIEIAENSTMMEEVVITSEEKDKNIQSTQMGTVTLPMESIRKLPVLMGEVDVLKAIQLLPGVKSAGEGSTGFYVRGGGADQNLVLLDEAVVYNTGHMLGFFSVFNGDAVKNISLIKGGMPANYGGRLSSVIDVQMKDGNDKTYSAEGGIGLIASRLTLQGPIQKEKSSFIVSARRTYVLDLAQPFLKGTEYEGTNYYFYDLNTKVNYRLSDKDRLYLSGYFGRDVFAYNNADRGFKVRMPYGNATTTLRWNHVFNQKMFMNLSAIYNDYDFTFTVKQDEFDLGLFSGVRDWNLKLDFDYYPNTNHNIRYGINYTYHTLRPSVTKVFFEGTSFQNDLQPKHAHELAGFIADEWKISPSLTINAGLRYSVFQQVGPYQSKIDTTVFYDELEPVKTYQGLEPRLSGTLLVSPTSSLKFGISYTNQYLHLVSNSTSTLPTDVWVPSTELVRPQTGVQYALGYFRNFSNNMFETSVEIYYKDLQNQIDYPESYVGSFADDTEESFVFGKGKAYGIELFIKKSTGRLNGWVGYTLSRTERIFEDINNGEPFPAVHDRTHDVVVVANYQLSKKFDLGGVFVYSTGNSFTPIKSIYFIDQQLNIEYGARNSARFQPYNRMDLSLTYNPNPEKVKKFKSTWSFSIYNSYSRLNPAFVYYDFNTDFGSGDAKATAYKVSLFPIIPSITWNFKWHQ